MYPNRAEAHQNETLTRPLVEGASTVLASTEHPGYTADRGLFKELCGGKSAIVAVFDGVGSGGEASGYAAEVCSYNLQQETANLIGTPRINEAVGMIKRGLEKSRQTIEQAQRDLGDENVDTTACVGIVCESPDKARRFLTIGNVGDSRIYRYRPKTGEVAPLTTDHSLVERLVQSGQIEESEAFLHPQRNVIYRAVGSMKSPENIDFYIEEIEDGDMYIAVSDGVTDNLTPEGFPIAVRTSFKSSYDAQRGSPDLKAFSREVATRAQNISRSPTAEQAKADDTTVAILRLPRK